MASIESSLSQVIQITPTIQQKLEKLGIATCRDLLYHFPHRYEDYSQIISVDELQPQSTATIIGAISAVKSGRSWKKRMIVTEALIQDDTGYVRAVWFNQRFIANSLKKGMAVRISGKVTQDKQGLVFSNPAMERASREPTQTGRLVPVYPETEGLTSKWLRWKIGELLKQPINFQDPLPEEVIKKLHLPSLQKALFYIHFPKTEQEYLLAQKRFAFEQMLIFQLQSVAAKNAWDQESATPIRLNEALIKNFTASLPFQLTNAQQKASFEILSDLEKTRPMNRLLNGDVGSGKTIIAAIAALQVSSANHQVAIMAPTEVLARQHYESFNKLFSSHKFSIGLLTNAYKIKNDLSCTRKELLDQIASGKINVVIGTHALIQESVKFHNLALVVIDEQHRFGVAQRAFLQQKTKELSDGIQGKIPHLLTMTATPIPRTFALTFFGSLDLSLLDEMPKNRKKIITQIIPPRERENIYHFVESEIEAGRQIFVILPLVEESKIMTEVKAATVEHERLSKKIFPHRNIGLLHGRMKAKEKEVVMQSFKDKKYDILVSTAVVEVGIDIPNATVMIIEDADRFGLAQLHQFRGRVGRSDQQSYCFLFSETKNNARLKILEKYASGFDVAEKDLKLRGPGEFLGTAQSGLPDITMENLANVRLIEIARAEAENILRIDPTLNYHPLLKKTLDRMNRNVHFE